MLLAVSPEWYKVCEEAGFLLRHDSPALAKNWRPESGLEPPPWFDAEGNQIEYIGACPEVADQPAVIPPGAPEGLELNG